VKLKREVYTQRNYYMRNKRKAAICKPGREASEETILADT
jgi:hypothetical protein